MGIVTWPLLVTRIAPPLSITYYGNTLPDILRAGKWQAVVHACAPQEKIFFNTKPNDNTEAVQRWV
jgi:hypothetical protein